MTALRAQSVTERFSKASSKYHQAATVQQQVGRNLLAYNPLRKSKVTVDLGCGPGTFAPHLKKFSETLLAVDLSADMLKQCQANEPLVVPIQADAQHLPLPDASVDLIFSSLAIQWMPDMKALFDDVYRVLKPGGAMIFTSVCEGSLWQLKKAWRKVDDFDHVNKFASRVDIEKAAKAAKLQKAIGVIRPHTFWYPDIKELFASIRDVGANTVLGAKRKGLIGRKTWQQFSNAYEGFRAEDGLPLTYQIYYGVVSK